MQLRLMIIAMLGIGSLALASPAFAGSGDWST